MTITIVIRINNNKGILIILLKHFGIDCKVNHNKKQQSTNFKPWTKAIK